MPIYDALYHESSIKVIAVKHEENAAVMADVYGRLTGEPGVCIVTAGPGATNSVTGVAQAFAVSSPMVHISGAVSESGEAFHGIGDDPRSLQKIFHHVSKWSVRIESVRKIQPVLKRAFEVSLDGRKGPTHVEMPLHIQNAEGELRQLKLVNRQTWPSSKQFSRACTIIAGARRPLIFAGEEVLRHSASDELLVLAETINAPVVVSDYSIDVFPHDHSLYIGYLPGNYDGPYWNPVVRLALQESDLLLLVGAKLTTVETSIVLSASPKNLISVASHPSHSDQTRRMQVELVGDIRQSLRRLCKTVRSVSVQAPEHPLISLLRQHRQAIARAFEQIVSDNREAKPIHPGLVASTVRKIARKEAIVATDVGSHAIWMRDYFHAHEPNTYLEPGNYGSMGFAFPAAVAAKIIKPDRQVIAVTGDGGFLMSLMDLPTVIENDINIALVVMNDSKYGMIWQMQEDQYHGRHLAVDLGQSDFAALARNFGAQGIRVEDPEDLVSAIEEALSSNKATVVDVVTDYRPDYACRQIFKRIPDTRVRNDPY